MNTAIDASILQHVNLSFDLHQSSAKREAEKQQIHPMYISRFPYHPTRSDL